MSLSRQQLTLIGIFALFFGPVILVMMMRSSWWQYQPANLKNEGQLVTPPTPLTLSPSQEFGKKWLILYVLDTPCEKACIEHVTALRQIHKAAGRNREHLGLVLLATGDEDPDLQSRLETIYPAFMQLTDSENLALPVLTDINSKLFADSGESRPIQTYILDPMLNVILAYEVGGNPNSIHKDLKRLLKWSDQESKG
jgi:hypothetical protein